LYLLKLQIIDKEEEEVNCCLSINMTEEITVIVRTVPNCTASPRTIAKTPKMR